MTSIKRPPSVANSKGAMLENMRREGQGSRAGGKRIVWIERQGQGGKDQGRQGNEREARMKRGRGK